ncbi:hypothetical protein CNMCM5793_009336 [Aspergillus hiratsukae]|uniref:Uncharacterized protein n=1 Tax=Aspergillus hiratsukae TaxID=1194566 RepID=A0A8H6Q9W9_9EURO|nr:hypothetical protein CNMCM5793_009336 [Aspergillus hiratsukae]KAF7169196.1 hypothetical protein CNMCM6106_004145 [Aspergillus hiratsukae]
MINHASHYFISDAATGRHKGLEKPKAMALSDGEIRMLQKSEAANSDDVVTKARYLFAGVEMKDDDSDYDSELDPDFVKCHLKKNDNDPRGSDISLAAARNLYRTDLAGNEFIHESVRDRSLAKWPCAALKGPRDEQSWNLASGKQISEV